MTISKTMVTVIPRHRLMLWAKLLKGLAEAQYLFYVAFLIIIIFGADFNNLERDWKLASLHTSLRRA